MAAAIAAQCTAAASRQASFAAAAAPLLPPPRRSLLQRHAQRSSSAAASSSSYRRSSWAAAPRRRLAAAAAGSSGSSNGNGAAADDGSDDDDEQEGERFSMSREEMAAAMAADFLKDMEAFGGPDAEAAMTPEERAEAERLVQDFMEGLGPGGLGARPEDADLPEGELSWSEINAAVGMSGWRINQASKISPEIEELTAQMEGIFRRVLPDDQFGLAEMPERFKYLDSLDPTGANAFAFLEKDPPRGSPGYPRLQVENRAYSSRALRKLHIEVAVRQDGLQVFHCVICPRLEFDLPILSIDLVVANERVTLAIVDPCPLSPSLKLPPIYEGAVRDLQARYRLVSNRRTPDWGKAIFSDCCLIMAPETEEDLEAFLQYTLALVHTHVEVAKIAHPITAGPGARRRLEALHAAHQRYCEKQLENDKTRRVLEAAFGPEVAGAYMREAMFDLEPLPEDPFLP